jgi:hypothetical protein
VGRPTSGRAHHRSDRRSQLVVTERRVEARRAGFGWRLAGLAGRGRSGVQVPVSATVMIS